MLLPLTTSKSSSFTVCGTGVALLLDEFSDYAASTELLLEPASTDVEDSGTASEEEPVEEFGEEPDEAPDKSLEDSEFSPLDELFSETDEPGFEAPDEPLLELEDLGVSGNFHTTSQTPTILL